jgi:hypothetical protein
MPDIVRRFTHLCVAKMHIHISSHPHLRKQALHFRRKAKSFTLRSNASRREEFPALHVVLQHANQQCAAARRAAKCLAAPMSRLNIGRWTALIHPVDGLRQQNFFKKI